MDKSHSLERHRALADRAAKENAIKEEYDRFLKENGLQRSTDSADRFATRATKNGDYDGFSEKRLIMLLAGELPPFYD